jgi:hypothetical protein
MSEQPKLGQILSGVLPGRDAVHIAIAPVQATMNLTPGREIGFVREGNTNMVGIVDTPIGIVDPFLKHLVVKGQYFYMYLFPQTITSLRHDWTHPAFEEDKRLEASKAWIEEYAQGYGFTYEEFMDAADDLEDTGDGSVCGGDRMEGESTSPEFWQHWSVITGRVPQRAGSFFRCAC